MQTPIPDYDIRVAATAAERAAAYRLRYELYVETQGLFGDLADHGPRERAGCQLLLAECEPHLVNKWIRLGLRPYGLCEHATNGTLAAWRSCSGISTTRTGASPRC